MANFCDSFSPVGNVFAKTMNLHEGKADQLNIWLSSTFPVLSKLLDKVSCEFSLLDPDDLAVSASTIKELEDLFLNIPQNNLPQSETVRVIEIPVYENSSKFIADIYPEEKSDCKNSSFGLDKPLQKKLDTCSILVIPTIGNCLGEYSEVQYHSHKNTDHGGLLQLCEGSKTYCYRLISNRKREMDEIIFNPETNLCRDAMDSSCKLELPGPYGYPVEIKKVKFNSNRHCLDVLGLLLLLVDTVCASSSVKYVEYNGALIPCEFTQDVVKVVTLVEVAFPLVFHELQKLVMYSPVISLLKKVPLRWNRCMVQVFEDLILHPLNYINKQSVEFELLKVIVKKRAKFLCKMFVDEKQSLILSSSRHSLVLRRNFTSVHMTEIESFLKASARTSLLIHRVKNVRYSVNDKLFESYVRDVFLSYC